MRVHDIIDSAAAGGPAPRDSVDDIVTSGRRRQRRRRAGIAAGGSGVAIAAVAVAVGVAVSNTGAGTGVTQAASGGSPAAATTTGATKAAGPANFSFPDDPFTYTFGAFSAGPLHVQKPVVAGPSYQIATIYMDGRQSNDFPVSPDAAAASLPKRGEKPKPTIWAYLTLYRPGAFDPATLKGATTKTIDGHEAREVGPQNNGGTPSRVLAWKYADNAWAVVSDYSNDDNSPTAAQLEGLVPALKPVTPAAAKLPFTMTYVPAGYKAVESGEHATAGLDGIASAREGDFGGATFVKPGLPSGLSGPYSSDEKTGLYSLPTFQVYVVPAKNSNQKAHGTGPTCISGVLCNMWTADGKVNIQVATEESPTKLSTSEMTKIVQGIKLADVSNDSTWTDAGTALAGK